MVYGVDCRWSMIFKLDLILECAGTQTAAIGFDGYGPGGSDSKDAGTYNGTTWTESYINDYCTGRIWLVHTRNNYRYYRGLVILPVTQKNGMERLGQNLQIWLAVENRLFQQELQLQCLLQVDLEVRLYLKTGMIRFCQLKRMTTS